MSVFAWDMRPGLLGDDYEPDVLTEITETNMTEFMDHAKVLAMVDAYNELTGESMNYSTLIQLMYAMRTVAPHGLALTPKLLIERSLRSVLTDCERMGAVEISTRGSRVTDKGHEQLELWGADYEKRRDLAKRALVALQVAQDTTLNTMHEADTNFANS